MPPLSFSDEEADLLNALASALPPSARRAFLEIVSNKLGAYSPEMRGPGLLHRIAAEAQRDFVLAGPVAVGTGGKHGRPQRRRQAEGPVAAAYRLKRGRHESRQSERKDRPGLALPADHDQKTQNREKAQ